MRLRRLYYGWFDPRTQTFRLSSLPPDSPVRASTEFLSCGDAMALATKKKAQIMWSPPLTREQERYQP